MKRKYDFYVLKACLIIVIFVFLLSVMSGCASNPSGVVFQAPEVKTVTVEKIVPVQCLSPNSLPVYPKLLTPEELKSLDDYSFVTMLYVERKMLIDYTSILSAAIAPCM